jgi:hypothetical protein
MKTETKEEALKIKIAYTISKGFKKKHMIEELEQLIYNGGAVKCKICDHVEYYYHIGFIACICDNCNNEIDNEGELLNY